MSCFTRLPTLIPLVGLLARLAAGEAPGPITVDTGNEAVKPHIDAPNLEFSKDGAVIAPRGFVVRIGDRILIGNALRYHQQHDDLYATGDIVMVVSGTTQLAEQAPGATTKLTSTVRGVRLHAARIGLHPQAQTGDAWDVEAFIDQGQRRIVIKAERVHIDRLQLRFEGISAITGHGGLIGMGASSAIVHLREEPAADRTGFERQVSGIEVIGATARIANVPVLWLPYLYRDFIFDYPWTRYEFGRQRRLGYYARAWVGTSLKEILGWHPRLEARGDLYSRSGEAWGMKGEWHSEIGHGQASYFEIPHEIVMGGADDRQNVATRNTRVVDLEQQLHGFGGAIYGRYVELPDTDPIAPGDPVRPWDERFRADYLRNDLEHRPFARQGVTGTWGTSFGTITLDTEQRTNPEQPLTDRLWGVQVQLPHVSLGGPLHASGDAWSERLDNNTFDDAAVRTSYSSRLSAMRWFGPLGIDLGGGIDGLNYQDARFGGVDLLDDQSRLVPVYLGGVSTRFVGDWGAGMTHVVTPRVGIEWHEKGQGDTLSAWRFGDTRDTLIEDRHLAVTSLDTSITKDRTLFRALVVARWGLRLEDRFYVDKNGVTREADSSLYDVTGQIEGSPIASLRITGAARYDGQAEAFRTYDVGSSWVPASWLALRYNGTLVPETATTNNVWLHRPGTTLVANRYRLDADVTFRPGGNIVDQWFAQITRRMVDGDLTFTYELLRDENGSVYDQRFGVGFSLSLGGSGAAPLTAADSMDR